MTPNLNETRVLHLEIKGQPYVCTFVPAGADPLAYAHWRVVRQTGRLDNLRGGYLVRVDDKGQPYTCTCPDCYHRSNRDSGEIRVCKHVAALITVWQREQPGYQQMLYEALQRAGMRE